MSRGVIIIALAVALAYVGATADSIAQQGQQAQGQQALNVVGKWAVSQSRCADEALEFTADGHFTSTLDENEPRGGSYKTRRDRIILVDDDAPDEELTWMLIDFSPQRLVAFDETIEADRRLVRCR